jgi:hypothetical protein
MLGNGKSQNNAYINGKILAIAILFFIGIYGICVGSNILFAYVAPKPEYPLNITSMDTYTSFGIPQNNFIRGSLIEIKARVEHAIEYITPSNVSIPYEDSQYYIVFITISDPNGNPISIYSTVGSLSAAESWQHTYRKYLPPDLPSGEYTYKVLVWTNSLPLGEPLTPLIAEDTFTLT